MGKQFRIRIERRARRESGEFWKFFLFSNILKFVVKIFHILLYQNYQENMIFGRVSLQQHYLS